jgi:2-polyprenyl-3-methyl-5-hydroxy-6-metoxy-1,4-benzoquinol methylase
MYVMARTGVRVNPFTRGFNLTPSMAVNYMLIASRDQQSWIS